MSLDEDHPCYLWVHEIPEVEPAGNIMYGVHQLHPGIVNDDGWSYVLMIAKGLTRRMAEHGIPVHRLQWHGAQSLLTFDQLAEELRANGVT